MYITKRNKNIKKSMNPDTSTASNTSPLGILDLGPQQAQYVTTHDLSEEAKCMLQIKKKPFG